MTDSLFYDGNLVDMDKDKKREYNKAYRKANKDKLLDYGRQWRKAHREEARAATREWRKADPDRERESQRNYIKNHKEEVLARARAYRKRRRLEDPLFKLSMNIRVLVSNTFRRRTWTKGSKTHSLLGCNYSELMDYLEKLFWPGMTRSNYGKSGWTLDHVVPLANARNEEELRKLCHYSNLQPLWADDNLTKRSRCNWIPQESHHELPPHLTNITLLQAQNSQPHNNQQSPETVYWLEGFSHQQQGQEPDPVV